jgi:hypothetical protein
MGGGGLSARRNRAAQRSQDGTAPSIGLSMVVVAGLSHNKNA